MPAHGVWLAWETLERQKRSLYDSAVLLKPDGSIGARQAQPAPNGTARGQIPHLPPGHGTPVAATLLRYDGVCADLFDDDIVAASAAWASIGCSSPSPGASPMDSGSSALGDRGAAPIRTARQNAQTPALMVNYLADASLGDDNSFGGACAISATGRSSRVTALAKRAR